MTGIAQQQWSASSTSDGQTTLETDTLVGLRTFYILANQGSVRVYVSLDGTTYAGSALALVDLHAVDNVPVTQTASGKAYAFYGPYKRIKLVQAGATAVSDLTLTAFEE